MSDEIEIEEHDLLDDPTVRNIFPDISRLKQEILDYDYLEDPDLENAATTSTQQDSYEIFNAIKSSAGGKRTENISPGYIQHNLQKSCPPNGFIRGDKGIDIKICNNKIILGSKPGHNNDSNKDHFEKNIKPFCSVLLLEDFGIFLKTCPRYCQHCHILFPTNEDYNNHERSVHDDLEKSTETIDDNIIARSDCSDRGTLISEKNKEGEALEEFDEKDVQNKSKTVLFFDDNAICHICNVKIKYKRNLRNHMLQVHNINEKKLSETMKNKRRKEEVSREKPNKCFHCDKLFRTQGLLIEHIYSIIQNPKSDSFNYATKIVIGNKPVKPDLENRNTNPTDVPSKSKPNINVEVFSPPKSVSTNFEKRLYNCHLCFLYFNTTKIYLRHMKLKHRIFNNFEISKVVFDPKCKYCPKENNTLDTYNSHLRKSHPKKMQEAIEKSRRLLVSKKLENGNLSQESSAQNKYYRCEFCSLYFKTVTYLIRHVTSKHKVLNVSKPKKILYDPKCIHCHGTYPNAKRYNLHLRKVHLAICHQPVKKSASTKCEEKESSMVSTSSSTSLNVTDLQVYRCKLCPTYFVTLKRLRIHLNNKHKLKSVPEMQKEKFDPKCKYCSRKFSTVISINNHVYKCHPNLLKKFQAMNVKMSSKNFCMKPKISDVKHTDTEEDNTDFIKHSQKYVEMYRCHYCPSVFKTTKFYKLHVRIRHQHNITTQPKKVLFDLKCKYCFIVLSSIKAYNQHLFKRHHKEIKKDINSIILKKDSNQKSEISPPPKKDSNQKSVIIPSPKKDSNQKSDMTAVDKKRKLFYRCCYCSHYFNSFNVHNSHVKRKHKVKNPNIVKKIEFDPHCKYCPFETNATNVMAYNKHLYRRHNNRVNEVFTGRNMTREINASKKSLSIAKKPSLKSHHPIDDKIPNVSSDIIPILKSALFKCHKCDIHFLTIKTALDHSNHMELLVNWKCSLCNRIFKDNDRWLHEKQHLLSNVFTVYDVDTAITAQILYKCNKCGLHFDESVDGHYQQCAVKIPQSYSCEICKILIDSNAQICHEYNHKHRHLSSNDFIVIEIDVIIDGNKQNNLKRKFNKIEDDECDILKKKVKKNNVDFTVDILSDKVYKENDSGPVGEKQQKFDKLSLKLSFCSYCESFVSPIGQKRREHGEGLCENMRIGTCNDCGLSFSCHILRTHRKVHQRIKNLQLQNFKFYDFKSPKRTLPPMPKHKKCGSCDVNFISRTTLRNHVCSDLEYKLCEICNIKLFPRDFNLHMPFHKYIIDEASCASNNAVAVKKEEGEINKANEKISLILYFCKVCSLYMDTYDCLIEHCHKHCLDTLSTYTEECKICKLKFENSSLKTHLKIHEKLGEPSFDKFFIDPFYFKFENKVWLKHVFGSIFKYKVKDIIQTSRYAIEHRFILHIIQEGRPDLTIYKCNQCLRCVEPNIIYQHIENSCSNVRNYLCTICNLDFISSFSLDRHMRTHSDPEVTLKSYRILHFNKQEDAALNAVIFSPPKKYVLYQCRHCNGIVETIHRMSHVCEENGLTSCADCGLLITAELLEHHVSEHKTLDSYISENMKVILFGEYELHDQINPISKPTFRGKVHDYSFYKCRNCYVCVKQKKSTLTHKCCYTNSRVACSKCGLYFITDKLVPHTKSHENDPDFILDNMTIVDFNPTIRKSESDEFKIIDNTCEKDCAEEIDCVDVNKNINESTQISSPQENGLLTNTTGDISETEVKKITDIYKCNCGLHFIDENTIIEHIAQCGSKAKQAKQNCSKCGLLFTPNVLFKHLLSHHGDKLINYTFNIIQKTKV